MGMSTLSAATRAFTVSMLSAGGQSMRMTSKASRLGCSAWRSLTPRPIGRVSRRTSAAVRSWLDGSSMKPPSATGTSAAASSDSPSSTSQAPRVSCALSIPLPMVALPWGSRSTRSTRRWVAASDAARLTAVVVLPTPPFWFAMAMTRFMGRQCTSPPARRWMRRFGATSGGPGRPESRPHRGIEPGKSGVSGHHLLRAPSEPLARHLVRDRVGRAVLVPRALEDLGEPQRDLPDIVQHLRLGGAALILARGADDPAGVDHVVGRVEDSRCEERLAVLSVRALIVRSARDDAGAQAWNRPGIEHRAERTGSAHVGDLEPRALAGQQPGEMGAHAPESLDGDGESLEVRAAELEPCGGLDAEMHAERGLRRGIAARLARRAPESGHEARRARDTRHVGRGRADVLGGHVAPAE